MAARIAVAAAISSSTVGGDRGGRLRASGVRRVAARSAAASVSGLARMSLDGAVGTVLTLKASPGKGAELVRVTKEAAAEVIEADNGELHFQMLVDADDSDTVILTEIFASEEARQAHFNQPNFKALMARLQPLMAAPPHRVRVTPAYLKPFPNKA